LAFCILILLNAVMLTWPLQFLPALGFVPLYLILILICLALALPAVLSRVSFKSLAGQPITVCVLGVAAAAFLTDLLRGQILADQVAGIDMLKVAVSHVLLITLIDSPARLRRFMKSFVLIAVVVTVLAEAHFYGVIFLPTVQLASDEFGFDPATGEVIRVPRLYGIGVYGDPNDFCQMLSTASAICISALSERRALLVRLLWASPILLFAHAFLLTGSRGGMIGMLAMLATYSLVRFGWKKAIPLLVIALPVILGFAGGRQSNFDIEGGTGQSRIQLWNIAFNCFFARPVLGAGTCYVQNVYGHTVHNSYIHAYAELGFIGGTFFVGAFYLALRTLLRLGSPDVKIADPELRRLRPCLLAIIAGYCAGMLSLSEIYMMPTYMYLGLVSAFVYMANITPPLSIQRFDARRLVTVSVVFLILAYFFVRLSVH
jgi:O-antigen ligase